LAWLIRKIHGRQATRREWTILTFLVLITHIFLDCFTVYGTQLFLPFSDYMVGFNSIAIIDPLYTIPLLGGIILALFFRRYPQRRIFNYLGLMISSVYLIFTLAVKFHVSSSAGLALKSQDIEYDRLMTTPTLFNSFLWRITAEVDEGYQIGYYSILDNDDMINFRFVPRNENLIKSVKHEKALQRLLWFSNGYYVVSKGCDANLFHDLRFGEIQTDFDLPGQYIFTWKLIERGNGPHKRIELQRADFEVKDGSEAFLALWSRIKGT
jgi:inner membrane protein